MRQSLGKRLNAALHRRWITETMAEKHRAEVRHVCRSMSTAERVHYDYLKLQRPRKPHCSPLFLQREWTQSNARVCSVCLSLNQRLFQTRCSNIFAHCVHNFFQLPPPSCQQILKKSVIAGLSLKRLYNIYKQLLEGNVVQSIVRKQSCPRTRNNNAHP